MNSQTRATHIAMADAPQVCAPADTGNGATRFQLRLLATSDLHARIMPHDYAADRPLAHAGLARIATLVRAARAEVLNCLTFDNGDFLEGEALSELHARSGGRGVHPVIAAMNAVGYDAATLGNHEFSYGMGFLSRALAQAEFPVLGANAVRALGPDPTGDSPFCPPVLILDRVLAAPGGERAPFRVGLIGLMPPQIDIWEDRNLAGRIATRDIIETAEAWVPRLKAGGADLVVALCHSGVGGSLREERMENAVIPLSRIAGIDVIVAGHTHLVFPGPEVSACAAVDPLRGTVNGTPTVMMGFWGSHLGIVDLSLDRQDCGWRVGSARVTTRAARLAEPDAAVTRAVAPAHAAALAFVRQPIGVTDLPLHTYFAQVADSAALTLVHQAQLGWLAGALEGGPHAALPRLSAASPFKSGDRGGPDHFTDIARGPIHRGNLYDLYMYPNAIRALLITGATLAEWLERAAARFLTLTPGLPDQPLLDPEAAAYNFDAIAGVSYRFDLSVPARYGPHGQMRDPAASRLRDLSRQGRPVRSGDRFAIVTNSFRAAGGGGYPPGDGTLTGDESTRTVADLLRDHVRRHSPLNPSPAGSWHLSGLPPGTGAWFDTGPGARAHLHEAGLPPIEPVGLTPSGFLRCRLRF